MLLWIRKNFTLIITKIMTKKLRKEIMTRSHLRISIIKIAYKKTGQTIKSTVTFAQTFWRKQKLITLNIHIKNITDNKRFWTTVKPFFTNKSKTCNNIILNENDKTIKDGKEIRNKFNKHFANNIKKLNLKKDTGTSFESQESYRVI